MSAPLSLAQMLGLWKWLSVTLAKDVREDRLLPQAEAEMPPGARLPIMFGGKLAGWASMPQPNSVGAVVKDEPKLLRWAKANYPEKIEHPVEVKIDAGLIEFLQEHRPESLHTSERVDPQWVSDICHGLSGDDGRYITAAGDLLTAVPGIEVPDAKPPVPHVNLEKNAGEIIRSARAAGQIDFADVLALPPGDAPGEAPHAA